jgi:hypothetical protein
MNLIEKYLPEGKKKISIKVDRDIMSQKKSIRIPVPPVGGTMKDKSKYNRKEKHKKGLFDDINERYELVKTGGRTSSKITSFSSSEPGTYDIVKDGKKVGEMYSMRDMDYPKANVTKWVAFIDGKKTKEFQYFKQAKSYVLGLK